MTQFAIGTFACAATSAGAIAQPGFDDPPMHSSVELISETQGLTPETTTKLAFVFELDEGWHTYADTINDSGSPLLTFWSLPDGIEIGNPIWPASHRYTQAGGVLDHVYEDKLVLTMPVTVTADAEVGTDVEISASLEWLVCDDAMCVPQFDEVSITLPVVYSSKKSEHAGLFKESREGAGKLLTGGRDDRITVEWRGDTLVLSNMLGYGMSFIPGSDCTKPTDLYERGHSDTGKLELTFDFDDDPNGFVEGWVRLHKVEGQTTVPIENKLFFFHLKRGMKPSLIVGDSH